MVPSSIIKKKRNGAALTRDELRLWFDGYSSGAVDDAQMAAFLMAAVLKGMNREETIALTEEYVHSGQRLDLSGIPGVCVDKHSTGGVGDKTTLLLAPIVSAAGVRALFVSGHGLDFTGGTLDKLESIPGMRVRLTRQEIVYQLQNTGAVFAGQSDAIVPLERRIYSLRDATATVESLPLIAASIISKKVAGGCSSLVLDVKCGKGTFMRTAPEAEALALFLADIGNEFDLEVGGIISSMNEPLGYACGNWLEVVEAVDYLQGRRAGDLHCVTMELAGRMIYAGKKASSIEEGKTIAEEIVRSGLAYQKFLEIVGAQGGDTAVLEDTLRYAVPGTVGEVTAARSGYIAGIDARAVGEAVRALGAGRFRPTDDIDSNAGMVLLKKCGEYVEEGDALCRLQCSGRGGDLSASRSLAERAFTIHTHESVPVACILATIDGGNVQRLSVTD